MTTAAFDSFRVSKGVNNYFTNLAGVADSVIYPLISVKNVIKCPLQPVLAAQLMLDRPTPETDA